jgi:SMC interacting uncharacterized protein involved in chromosome segregation
MEPTIEKTEQYLKYTFSAEEVSDMSQKMAQAVDQMDSAQNQKKSVVKQLDAQIAEHEAVVKKNAVNIRQGWEMRNIKCTIRRDFEKGTYKVNRDDTGELIIDRLLTEGELQLQMAHS